MTPQTGHQGARLPDTQMKVHLAIPGEQPNPVSRGATWIEATFCVYGNKLFFFAADGSWALSHDGNVFHMRARPLLRENGPVCWRGAVGVGEEGPFITLACVACMRRKKKMQVDRLRNVSERSCAAEAANSGVY